MTPELAKALIGPAVGKPVTVETLGGFRAYGHDVVLIIDQEEPIAVALTVDNGRLTIPWHAVNLIHAHDAEVDE